jgi:hypothetical protein
MARGYAGAMTAPSDATSRRVRWMVIARAALVPYLIALALVVFLPAREAGRVTGIVGWAADLASAWFGLPREPTGVVFEFCGNILLFVPFGVLLVLAAPRWSPSVVIALGCLLSVGIELVQLGIPSRITAVSDVIANTTGAAIGCLLAALPRARAGSD